VDCFGRLERGKVGYLDAEGEIVIVEGWPLVGSEIKVWDLEKLLPTGKLVGIRSQRLEESAVFEKQGPKFVDAECDGQVLLEFKGHSVPCLDIWKGFVRVGLDGFAYEMPKRGSGIARSLFSKAFAMAEAIRAGP
jgi:hypothetical protein